MTRRSRSAAVFSGQQELLLPLYRPVKTVKYQAGVRLVWEVAGGGYVILADKTSLWRESDVIGSFIDHVRAWLIRHQSIWASFVVDDVKWAGRAQWRGREKKRARSLRRQELPIQGKSPFVTSSATLAIIVHSPQQIILGSFQIWCPQNLRIFLTHVRIWIWFTLWNSRNLS